MEIHDKIRFIREQQHITQEEMAEKLNLSASGYSKIERGETKLQFQKLEQIARIFQMNLTDLIGLNERNIALLITESGSNNSAQCFSGSATNIELEKLKLTVAHQAEMLEQKNAEIVALKRVIELLDNQN
ncbi:helix-turn-helix domain-containing protein [Conchiformibius steedae]|uniref:XRE family transcriptional regulator n=1 Tax=Conchiformibius steedae TaxID=153493 RepID=A0A3P2A671_9NEIS|nr:helix-turn-helix transcriptional regulator [Conchiformibius steedae]RRD90931.1 XRE family transcriptional regulator [Conchiformibius steedae]